MRTRPNCLWQGVFMLCLGIIPLLGFTQSPPCNTNPPKTYTLAPRLGEIYLPATSNGILSSVRGGDTVLIPAGQYNDIILENFSGDACNPVVIMNSGGLVTTNYIRIDHGAQYFKLTGTGDSTIKYGFKIGATGVGAGLAVGLANHYEITNIECANSEVGFLCKKNPNTAEPLTIYPNYFINTVLIHDNYIHNTHGEGMYIGHTYPLADPYNGNQVPIQMDSVQIYNNLVDSTDWDGIQLSNARDGAKIYNNVVKHFGLINMGDQQAGIILGANTSGDIFNNIVESGTGNGMQVFGYGKIGIYNNLVVDAGHDGTANMQDAIFIDDRPMYNNPFTYIQGINNTIVNSGRDGIRMYNDHNSIANGNAFYNNLIVQPNSLVTHASMTPYLSFPTTLGTSGNNINLPTIAKALFVNSYTGDYHLLSGSPAIDTGADATQYGVITDLDHFNRPYGLKYDAGAYEFTNAPPPPNRIPIANAGVDLIIGLPNTTISLNGSGVDLDGVIISSAWTQISGPSISSITDSTKFQTTVTGLALGTYQFELTVMDNDSTTAKDTMMVTVLAAPPPNVLPTANAGSNQTITLPANSVLVKGTATDSDGTIAMVQWSQVSGPSTASITSPLQSQTTITALVKGTYTFQFKATDNAGGTATSTMQVVVNPQANIAPTANAGSNQVINLPINSTTLTGSGTDPDGTIASYQWTVVSGPAGSVLSNPATAQTQISNLVAGSYVAQLKVTDNSGAFGIATVQITVNPASPHINVPPTVNAGSDQSITLPTNTVSLNGTASDPDGSIASYQWSMISGPGACNISHTNTAQTSVTGLVQGIYKFQLMVTDDKGAVSKATIQVTVFPVPPVNGLNFNIYPNPATTTLYVTFAAPQSGQKTKLTITDMMGRVVYFDEFDRSDRITRKINVSTLMKGVYVVTVDTGYDILTARLIKD